MLGRPYSNKRPPLPGEYADGNTVLLQEIQALSRALSLPRPANSKPKTTPSSSQKKPSFWNWKPLKALSHIGQRRFDCVFSLHVHSIENLPAAVGDLAFSVHWKRTSDPPPSATGTSPVHAFHGVAEFDETLTYRCSVYGARKSSGHSPAKYEARQFVIYVSVPNAPSLDFGRQLVDVTRLLPLTLEALEDTENSSGKWSTSFRLSGPGKGAFLNVSFGFSLIGDVLSELSNERKMMDTLNLEARDESSVGKAGSKSRRWARSQSVDDVRELHEVLPSSKSDVSSLCDTVEKMEIANCEIEELGDFKHGTMTNFHDFCEDGEVIKSKPRALNDHFEGNYLNELEKPGIITSDQGVENSAEDQPSPSIFEKIDLDDVDEDGQVVYEEVEGNRDIICDHEESRLPHENEPPGMKDQEFEFDVRPVSEPDDWPAVQSEMMAPNPTEDEERNVQTNSFSFINSKEFGLRSDSDPESPRERLWKQFEEEALGAGGLLFSPAIDADLHDKPREEDDPSEDSDNFDLSHLVYEAERELLNFASQAFHHDSSAKFLEEAESEALMRDWGINEKAFQSSPPKSSNGGGDLVDGPSQIAPKLSPLADGFGTCLRTRDGGFLRSMSPSLFRNSKNNASLIMQVSSPVVVPAEMGHGVVEVLRRLASVGIDKLSEQAKNLMPLEDVSGKTMQQIAWEATASENAFNRETDAAISQNVSRRTKKENLNFAPSSAFDKVSEYVSVGDLAPLAMDKIEALCIDGLRIQSGMSDEEAPSNVSSQFIGNMSTVGDSLLDLDGAAGLQLLDFKGNADDADGLMSLSITLDEWLRLDSGILDDKDRNSDRTSKILAAHRGRTEGKRSGGSWGLLGSNFTAALMVQLRDPLRNFDPVGTPMLALVQVERVFVPPKPEIFAVVSERAKCEEDDEFEPLSNTRKDEEEETPQFMITKVHVAGLRTEKDEKRIWGNPTQQQSGSRWLVASGMGKSIKHPFMKSKASPVTATVHTGSALWSISSLFRGAGSKRKEMPAINPHVRNPNINFLERR